MVSLVVVGLVALDDVTTPKGSVEKAMGGAGCYSSVAASLFCKTGLVGIKGNDYPREYTELLEAKGVDLAGLQAVEGKSFHWKGKYGGDMGEAKTIETQLNALTKFRAVIPNEYKSAEYLLLTNLDPSLQLEFMRQSNAITAIDTMDYWIKNTREKLGEAIAETNILFVNEKEAEMLTNEKGLEKAGKTLLARGPETVVIKRGPKGAMLFDKDGAFPCPAYSIDLVDPTGCGDSFAGGFMGCLAAGKTAREAMAYGSAVASFNAEGFSLDQLKATSFEGVGERARSLRKAL